MAAERLDAQDFAQVASELHTATSGTETAAQVVEFARSQLDADHAGITLIRGSSQLECVAPSAPVVEEIDRLQAELGEGACLESAWESETLVSSSVGTDPRWPEWGPRVAALGVESVLAVELAGLDGHRAGALNLYWSHSRSFTRDDTSFAQVFGRHAALALEATMRESNLLVALDTRKRIGQAQGILMERYGLDEDRAFAVLRRYSQDNNLKLRDVAERLVATRSLPTE